MSEPTATPNTDETTPNPQQDSKPASGQGEQTTNTPIEPTLTQSEANKLIGKARSEGRDSERSKLLADLGIEDIDTLKSFVEAAKKRQEAEMTELEKAQIQIDAANKKAAEAEAAKQALEAKYTAEQQKQAFIRQANASGGQNVDDLFILIQAKHGDDFQSVFDNGQADDKKMESFMKQIQASFPSYFGTASAGSPSNAGGQAPSAATLNADLEKQLKRKFGKF